MKSFIKGLKLSERFYKEAVKPITDREFPGLKYSAGLIGYGSEVLGFDTEISTDHHWGPRVLLFLTESDFFSIKEHLDLVLRNNLQVDFLGYSVNYNSGDNIGVRLPITVDKGPVNHFVEFYTVKDFLSKRLGMESVESLTDADWLSIPEQRLLEIISGKIFVDKLNELEKIRETISYYPNHIWIYKMATEWGKIAQIEAFTGRCGHVGDELGSSLIAARIVKHIMNLCYMMEKKYAPYAKWFGSGFKRLSCSKTLLPILQRVTGSTNWETRQKSLSEAYSILASMHNNLKITNLLPEKTTSY
jgi:hypothetical protein